MVKAGRDQRRDAGWHGKALELAGRAPAAVLLQEDALIHQHRDQLLHEQRVSLGCSWRSWTVSASSGLSSRLAISEAESSAPSGWSRMVVAFSLPPPQCGRASSSSGR